MIFNIKMYEPKKSYAVVKSTGYESVLRHSHEFVEMVFVESGSAVQKVNSETVELRRGDMFVIADDSEHSMRPTCEENDFKVVNIIWCKDFIEFDYSAFSPLKPVDISSRQEMVSLVYKALAAYEGNEKYCDGIMRGCIYFLLSGLGQMSDGETKSMRNHGADYVELAVKFISDNFYKKISLADVAEYVGLSSGYLQKLFNRERRTSVIEYLLRYRVEQSCKLLIESDKTISEISDVIGFSDIKNFHYAFKRITGITPNEYRRTHTIRSAETKNND